MLKRQQMSLFLLSLIFSNLVDFLQPEFRFLVNYLPYLHLDVTTNVRSD